MYLTCGVPKTASASSTLEIETPPLPANIFVPGTLSCCPTGSGAFGGSQTPVFLPLTTTSAVAAALTGNNRFAPRNRFLARTRR
jgi:hypothetical protein